MDDKQLRLANKVQTALLRHFDHMPVPDYITYPLFGAAYGPFIDEFTSYAENDKDSVEHRAAMLANIIDSVTESVHKLPEINNETAAAICTVSMTIIGDTLVEHWDVDDEVMMKMVNSSTEHGVVVDLQAEADERPDGVNELLRAQNFQWN